MATQLSIEQAKALRDALDKLIALVESRQVRLEDLPAAGSYNLMSWPPTPPLAQSVVDAAVARCQAARDKLSKETELARAIAMALEIAAAAGKLVVPIVALL